jgi:hypothetical protein
MLLATLMLLKSQPFPSWVASNGLRISSRRLIPRRPVVKPASRRQTHGSIAPAACWIRVLDRPRHELCTTGELELGLFVSEAT